MPFWIGVAECSLRLPYAGSLKERRHVVRSILERSAKPFQPLFIRPWACRQMADAELGLLRPVLLHLSLKKTQEPGSFCEKGSGR